MTCSADTALETREAGSTVQSDLGKDDMLRTPQVYHTPQGRWWVTSLCWLRKRKQYSEGGARGSNSRHFLKAPALLTSSSPSITSTPFYSLHLEGKVNKRSSEARKNTNHSHQHLPSTVPGKRPVEGGLWRSTDESCFLDWAPL